MQLIMDCKKCGQRFDWDTKDEDQRCARCKTLAGDSVTEILKELRKYKIPGQEPLLRLFEVLSQRIEKLEAAQ